MVNLIGSITTSMLNANSQSKLMDHATAIFESAKAKNDESTMTRAIGYANDASSEAQKETKKMAKELKNAVEIARAEKIEEQKESIEEAQEKKSAENNQDTLEISTDNGQQESEHSSETNDSQEIKHVSFKTYEASGITNSAQNVNTVNVDISV